jgi:hypothetical protein
MQNKFGQRTNFDSKEFEYLIGVSLRSLQYLCKGYDEGRWYLCFSISMEIYKCLEKKASKTLFKLKTFKTLEAQKPSDKNFGGKLVVKYGLSDPARVFMLPQFYFGIREEIDISFDDWWKKDVVFWEREDIQDVLKPIEFTRFELIKDFRNQRGAHFETELKDFWRKRQNTKITMYGNSRDDGSNRLLYSADGSLPGIFDSTPATIRQIAHELLIASGYEDPKPDWSSVEPTL